MIIISSIFIFHFIFQSEELTQQTNLVKPLPYGILGSPQRRKQMAISGGSPQMKGSFLHKTVSVEKAVENASPKRVRISCTWWNSRGAVWQENSKFVSLVFFFRFYAHQNLDVPGIHQLVRMLGENYRCPSMMTMMTRLVYCMGGMGGGMVSGMKQPKCYQYTGTPLIWSKTGYKNQSCRIYVMPV